MGTLCPLFVEIVRATNGIHGPLTVSGWSSFSEDEPASRHDKPDIALVRTEFQELLGSLMAEARFQLGTLQKDRRKAWGRIEILFRRITEKLNISFLVFANGISVCFPMANVYWKYY